MSREEQGLVVLATFVVVNWNKFSGLSVTSDGIISLGNGLGNQARLSTCCTQRA